MKYTKHTKSYQNWITPAEARAGAAESLRCLRSACPGCIPPPLWALLRTRHRRVPNRRRILDFCVDGAGPSVGLLWGVKFADANIGFENHILTLPWFTAFLLSRFLEESGVET